jgi:hypothetical protein
MAAIVVLGAWAVLSIEQPRAHGCAFSRVPNAYEAMRNRVAYLSSAELAAYNQIEPSNTFFGIPTVETGTRGNRTVAEESYVPPRLLKGIGWIESALAQAANSVPWGAVGPALVSFDCGHGIMQITSGMTAAGDSGFPSKNQSLVATHYLYNMARGSAILVEKWNGAPEVRPIAGTDTGSDPTIVENWYFAVWSYNGFTGPGANRSNHPADPIYAWPRTGFSCGPADDGYGHSYGNFPYQELVFGCVARPPSVDGVRLWTPLALSLPNLDNSKWSGPLSLSNFTSSDGFRRMDMPSPRPTHRDNTTRPNSGAAGFLRGSPQLVLSRTQVRDTSNQITISNPGTGIVAWRAKPQNSWLSVNKQAGVALASSVPCSTGAPCERSPVLTITVDTARAPAGAVGLVDIESLTTREVRQVQVITGGPSPTPVRGDANCDGVVNSIDSAAVLQYSARVSPTLPCLNNADVDGNGTVDVTDALLILQFNAGLIPSF